MAVRKLGYRGHDRREQGLVLDRATGLPWAVGGAALGVGVVLASMVAIDTDRDGVVNALVTHLDSAGLLLAAVLAAMGLALGRLAGDARALWIGIGLSALAAVALGDLLAAAGVTAGVQALAAVRTAAVVAAAFTLLRAATGPAVDTGLWTLPSFAVTALAGVAAWLVLEAALLVVAVPSPGWRAGVLHAVAAIALLVVAPLLLRCAARTGHVLSAWMTWMVLALAAGQVALVLQPVAASWLFVASTTRVLALAAGLAGALLAVRRVYATQRAQLLTRHVDHLSHVERVQLRARDRAHSARNALTVIEGATLTLERARERLGPEDRDRLTEAVQVEIARLQALVSEDETV